MTTVTITQSGLQCPRCKEIIFSNSRHDFVSCNCGAIVIDGGFDYFRAGFDAQIGQGQLIKRTINAKVKFKYFRQSQPKEPWTDKEYKAWYAENPWYKVERRDAS